MNYTDRYCAIVPTGQYGRFYVVNSSHARGRTFRIFLLPKSAVAKTNGPNNAPLNYEVELFGVVSGEPGWTEAYGWKYAGPWIEDFNRIVEEYARVKVEAEEALAKDRRMEQEKRDDAERQALSLYEGSEYDL